MTDVVVKLKVMPTGVEINLGQLGQACKQKIESFGGKVHKIDKVPIAFGMNALEFIFLVEEQRGRALEELEEDIKQIPDVSTVDITDVRRAFG